MNKTEFNALLRKLEYRGTAYIPPEPGKLTGVQVNQEGQRYTLYTTWPCHRDCVAADISKDELEKLLID